ncbi:MAG: hypothetical protein H0V92_08605 [Pseudonocardiales bacterium]|nr:hypothetical protein [Pseudonocardiales bacterium]
MQYSLARRENLDLDWVEIVDLVVARMDRDAILGHAAEELSVVGLTGEDPKTVAYNRVRQFVAEMELVDEADEGAPGSVIRPTGLCQLWHRERRRLRTSQQGESALVSQTSADLLRGMPRTAP